MSQTNVSQFQSLKSKQSAGVESTPQSRRRTWSVAAKLQVLKDMEALKGHQADIGAYLRRQGLFSSNVISQRQ